MTAVSFMHPGLRLRYRAYMKIRDVIEGVDAIKGYTAIDGGSFAYNVVLNGSENLVRWSMALAKRYLPQPNPQDTSIENQSRYRAYVERAQWLGATAQTLKGYRGQVFERPPEITLPDNLSSLEFNVDGGGMHMTHSLSKSVDNCIAYGRGGLLADYAARPDGAAVTQADINNGVASPVILTYKPWNIVNWRITLEGTKRVKELVVLRDENVWLNSDDFMCTPIDRYRVLRMVNGVYAVEMWQNDAGSTSKNYVKTATYIPKMANGQPFDHIPFHFLGAETNDEIPDKPPLEDLAEVNLGHYRNSADYEESVFLLGQPTPWASGFKNKTWFNEIWKGKKMELGARAFVPLPDGAAVGLLQAQPNTLAKEAMDNKVMLMILIGAKLMEPQGPGMNTATGELVDDANETSTLTAIANNVSMGYVEVIKDTALFVGSAIPATDKTTVIIRLNTAYQFKKMTAAERLELVSEWQKGAISWTEMRTAMRAGGIASQDDDTALAEIKKEQADAIATGIAFTVPGVDVPALAAQLPTPGGVPIVQPPDNQADNPVPPRKGAVKEKPKGKGSNG